MQEMIKLAIADDHTLFRKTLAEYLSKQSSFDVAITACNFSDLRDQLKSAQIDVLLTDIYMPSATGMESLKTIRTEYPDLKIVVLSMSTDIKLVNELLDIGIYAFISKADEAEQLVEAIIAAHNDQIYRNPYLTEALYLHKQINRDTNGDGLLNVLDDREKKVLRLLWQEKSNKDIAKEIFLSVRSVEKIRQDMKLKLGVKSMIGLLKYGLIHSIIEPTEIHVLDTSGYQRTMYA
jgi:DNA-binding NarL/FixJ family response regulator